jgi:1-acyl-sn-glycerol-3-phosphate acyltransferase
MRKLFRVPFIGDHITKAGYISLDTKDRKKSFKVIENIINLLINGESFVIFPEGKLTDDGSIREFSRGTSIIIQKGGKPVVPIAIDGSFNILPKGKWKLNNCNIVNVKIGKPLGFIDYKEVTKEASLKMSKELKEIIEKLKKDN